MFDHLLRRKVRTPLGVRVFDLEELRGWLGAHDVRFGITSTVVREVEFGLVGAIYDEFGGNMRLHDINRFERRARLRWEALHQHAEVVDAKVAPDTLLAAKQFFADHPRDLSAYSIRDKDSAPDPNDLRILLQVASVGRETHFFTRDGHFLAYRDLIASKWRVNVVNGARIILMLDEWSARSD